MPRIKKKIADSDKSKMEICDEKKVKGAIKALKLLNEKFLEELKKQPLLEDLDSSPIYLQINLKKIPPRNLMRMIRVPLPHSLSTETSEVCLITGDLDKRNHKAEIEPTVLHYKDLLRKHGVTKVSQVIPLRQLRTEYKTFESKRQLSAAYDVFLVDKKIAGVMAKTLGKSFFQSRKFPIQIDMRRPNLKDQIDKALCQTEFSLTCRGNSYAFEVARLSMEDNAIIKSIETAIGVLAKKLPGNKENILSLYIKTAKSKAIPIYVSLDIPDDILIKKPRRNDKCKVDELSTIDNTEVKVFRDGRVVLRKMKKESSSCEDAVDNDEKIDLNELVSDDDLIESEEDIQESAKASRKKKKKNVPDDILIKKPRKNNKRKVDELSTIGNRGVKVFRGGKIKKESSSCKDASENDEKIDLNELVSDDDLMESEEGIQESAKASRKKRKKNDPGDILIKKTHKNNKRKVDELSTTDNREVKVFRDRKMKKKSSSCEDATENNKKIDLNELVSNDDLIENEEDIQESSKASRNKKKKSKKLVKLNKRQKSDRKSLSVA